MYDIAIVGAGPAGVSAALTARARGKEAILISNDPLHSPLARAERIDNYPGLSQVTGAEMVQGLMEQISASGIERIEGRVVSILPFGEDEDLYFMVGVGADVYDAKTVILALGVTPAQLFPGEEEFLGKGVSYCATCDGMLYRNRPVCVVGASDEAQEEANFLASIGCEVVYVSKREVPEGRLDGSILTRTGRKIEVAGEERVTGLKVDEDILACDAVFILRPAIAPTYLLGGLEMDGAFIETDAAMATSVSGVFAAGDCTGKPLQVAKAVGEGQLAAFSAVRYLDELAR